MTTYQPEERSSPVADLLELIARKAPLFMRSGELVKNDDGDKKRMDAWAKAKRSQRTRQQ